jgi:hypothetical protein
VKVLVNCVARKRKRKRRGKRSGRSRRRRVMLFSLHRRTYSIVSVL